LKKASRSGEEELKEGEDGESQSMTRKVVAYVIKGWDGRRLNFSHPMVEMATCIEDGDGQWQRRPFVPSFRAMIQ
jgi:hypothetical protein